MNQSFFERNQSNTKALKEMWRLVSSTLSIPLRFASLSLSISGWNNPHIRNPYSVTENWTRSHPRVSLRKWSVRRNNVNKQITNQSATPTLQQCWCNWNRWSGVHVECFNQCQQWQWIPRLRSPHWICKTCIRLHENENVQMSLHSWFPSWHFGSRGVCRWQDFLWTSSLSVSKGLPHWNYIHIKVKWSKCFNSLPFWCWLRETGVIQTILWWPKMHPPDKTKHEVGLLANRFYLMNYYLTKLPFRKESNWIRKT